MNQSECEKILLDEEILEKMEAYVAGELPSEEARRVERLVREDPEALRMAGFYLRKLAMLDGDKGEPPGGPKQRIGRPHDEQTVGVRRRTKESFISAKRRLG